MANGFWVAGAGGQRSSCQRRHCRAEAKRELEHGVALKEPADPRQGHATIVAMSIEPSPEVRNHFGEIVDRVAWKHKRVTVTRNGCS